MLKSKPQRRTIWFDFVLLFGLLVSTACPAFAQMTFDAKPPDARNPLLAGTAWTIHATGMIDEGAPSRLKSLMADRDIPLQSYLYLDSGGGNLMAAIELGRVIRDHRLHTYVGNSDRNEVVPCLSACTLAYLGGYFRFYLSNAAFGVHRFFFPDEIDSASANAVSQVIAAQVVGYMREMGADPELFTEMTKAGSQRSQLSIRATAGRT